MRGLPRCVNYDKTAARRRFLNTRLRGAEWPLSGAGAEDVPLIAVSCGPAKSVLYIYILKERTPRSGLPVPGCIGVRGGGGHRCRALLCAVFPSQGFISVAGCHPKFDIKLSERKQKVLKIASLCSEGKTFPRDTRSPLLPRGRPCKGLRLGGFTSS